MDAVDRALESKWLPAICGALAFGVVVFVWGSLKKLPIGTDEAAYLLQARIFAAGHIVGPGRPLPEFFQQYHVFVTPVLAAKYPPGHSLLLVPGVWVGLPGLMPALLVAVSAAILCSVARRFTNGATAILAVILAGTSEISLRFQASYFSEMTTAAMFAIAWWTLLRYWDSPRARWLVACGIAVGWGAITRPLTMAAFALPTAVCAWLAVRRHRNWVHVIPAVAAGVFTVGIMFVWNARVVGDWRTMTLTAYTRLYSPTDDIGLGANPAPPATHLSADQAAMYSGIEALHGGYTAAAIPSAAGDRAAEIIRGTWSYGGLTGLFVLVGAAVLPAAVTRIILVTLLCVFGAYLDYAHIPSWTLYYLEFQAPLALLTAAGVWGVARWVATAAPRLFPRTASRRVAIQALVFGGTSLWLVAPVLHRANGYRQLRAVDRGYPERLERAVAGLPPGSSIVFVREAPGHGEQRLMENVPDLASASVWIVHDCGPDNARLLALSPGRAAYLYWESNIAGVATGHAIPLGDLSPTERAAAASTC